MSNLDMADQLDEVPVAPPNILLVCSDQHNYRVAGHAGDRIIETPNIDRLARAGVVFDGAYCNSPICVASRHSFLTGFYPFEIESLGNDSMLDPAVPTFAHMAVIGGYHTVLAGRMHLVGPNCSPGFQERITGDIGDYEHGLGPPSEVSDLGNMSKPLPLRRVGAGRTEAIDFDEAVTRDACTWLKERAAAGGDAKPFLMSLGYWAPHCPYIVPEPYFSRYAGRVAIPELAEEDLGRQHPSHRDYRRKYIEYDSIPTASRLDAKAAYYGLVDYLDDQIGQVLETLEKSGLLENTIVVYFSDHGEMMGEHGRWHKGCFYEDSARVPLIIRLPGGEEDGRRIEELVSLVDLFPTVCDWMGVEPPHRVSGNSLVPLLNGSDPDWRNDVKVEYYEGDSRRMLRRDGWKYSCYSDYQESELYNLDEDPEETRNLADLPEYAQIIAGLDHELRADGWNEDVLKKRDSRLSRFAYWTWRKQLREVYKTSLNNEVG